MRSPRSNVSGQAQHEERLPPFLGLRLGRELEQLEVAHAEGARDLGDADEGCVLLPALELADVLLG